MVWPVAPVKPPSATRQDRIVVPSGDHSMSAPSEIGAGPTVDDGTAARLPRSRSVGRSSRPVAGSVLPAVERDAGAVGDQADRSRPRRRLVGELPETVPSAMSSTQMLRHIRVVDAAQRRRPIGRRATIVRAAARRADCHAQRARRDREACAAGSVGVHDPQVDLGRHRRSYRICGPSGGRTASGSTNRTPSRRSRAGSPIQWHEVAGQRRRDCRPPGSTAESGAHCEQSSSGPDRTSVETRAPVPSARHDEVELQRSRRHLARRKTTCVPSGRRLGLAVELVGPVTTRLTRPAHGIDRRRCRHRGPT